MKSLSHIIEALPVSGYKPARPAAKHKPDTPAPLAHLHAQAMNPKGKLATVNKRSTMKKPGYALMKALPTITRRPARPKHHERHARAPKKPVQPVAYGKTIQEMKTTSYHFKAKQSRYSDPSVGIPLDKYTEDIDCEMVITWNPGELKDPEDFQDELIDEADATVKENEDIKPGKLKWKVTKLSPTSARLKVVDWKFNENLSLTKIVRAVTNE